MYLAMTVLTIYTHKTPCDSGNVTAEVGSATQPFGMMTGFKLNSDTLIPLISIMFIVFGEYLVFTPEAKFHTTA